MAPYKQWGHTTNWHDIATGNRDTIDFPIAFQKECMAVIVNSNGGGYPAACVHTESNRMHCNNFEVTWYEYDTEYVQTLGVNFLALGS